LNYRLEEYSRGSGEVSVIDNRERGRVEREGRTSLDGTAENSFVVFVGHLPSGYSGYRIMAASTVMRERELRDVGVAGLPERCPEIEALDCRRGYAGFEEEVNRVRTVGRSTACSTAELLSGDSSGWTGGATARQGCVGEVSKLAGQREG